MDQELRARLVNETMDAFASLALVQRAGGIPGWVDQDLTASQVRALYLLAYHGELAIGDLARALDVGNPAASILVQQLVQRDMVERAEDSADRRRTLVRLTGRGADLMTIRREYREAQGRRWLARLTDDDLAALRRGIGALLDVMHAEQQESGTRPGFTARRSPSQTRRTGRGS